MINKTNGLLGIAAKAGKVVSGTDVVIENISKKKVKLVIIAINCSDRTKKNIIDICFNNKISFKEYGTIDENSRAIGKENRAIIGIIDENLAVSILNIISGGGEFGKN